GDVRGHRRQLLPGLGGRRVALPLVPAEARPEAARLLPLAVPLAAEGPCAAFPGPAVVRPEAAIVPATAELPPTTVTVAGGPLPTITPRTIPRATPRVPIPIAVTALP